MMREVVETGWDWGSDKRQKGIGSQRVGPGCGVAEGESGT